MINELAQLLGCEEESLKFLSVHRPQELSGLIDAIRNALSRTTAPPEENSLEQNFDKILTLIGHPEPGHANQGVELLHALQDEELWNRITQGCSIVDGDFVSSKFAASYGLFRAWCENPFAEHQHVKISAWNIRDLAAASKSYSERAKMNIGPMLAPLSHLPSVELSVTADSLGHQLQYLASLPNLTKLSLTKLDGTSEEQFSVLESLPRLEYLYLHELKTSTLEFIKELGELKHLYLAEVDLIDLSGLDACISLEKLVIKHGKKLCSLKGLEGCLRLKDLSIEDCKNLSSLSSLSNCLQLESVYIRHASLSDLEGLENKSKLHTVNLFRAYKNLRSLHGLRGCTGLKKLHFITDGRGEGDFSPSFSHLNELSESILLEELVMESKWAPRYEFKHLSNISALSSCTNLRKLVLSHKNLSSLHALRTCTRLEYLDVRQCHKLKDLSGIQNHTSLQYLDIGGCGTNLTDEIQNLSSLSELRISGCQHDGRNSELLRSGFDIAPNIDRYTSTLKRAEIQAFQKRMALIIAIEREDLNTVRSYLNTKELVLYGSQFFSNPKLLQVLVNLEKLDLRKCTGLPVKSWQKNYNTPQKVTAFLKKIEKRYPL